MITLPLIEQHWVEDDYRLTDRNKAWVLDVTAAVNELQPIIGTGSPEGTIAAKQGRLYMDDTGVSGSLLYMKRQDDIGGDRSLGWIAV